MISELANSLFLTYLASEYLVSSSLSPPPSSSSSSSRSRSRTIQQQHKDTGNCNDYKHRKANFVVNGCLAFLVGIANLVDHHYYLSLVWGYARSIVPNHLPSLPAQGWGIPPYYLLIPAKLFLAATSYVLALYVDIHRDRSTHRNENSESESDSNSNGKPTAPKKANTPKMPFRSVFLPKVSWAFLKILPAYPFLAVLISFVFLFVVDLWEFVFHLPLEWLNNPIYYGTLYGPFAYTYIYVKKEVLRRSHYDRTKEYEYDRGYGYGYGHGHDYGSNTTPTTRTTDAFV